jgi:hypothetical protein
MQTRFYMAILLSCFAFAAQAQDTGNAAGNNGQPQGQRQGSGQGQNGQRREPPAQAYTACQGKKEGDAVQITTPRGEKMNATCTSSPKGLFARPEHPPR